MTTSKKRFRVALSFPSEHREFVAKVADHLAAELGQKCVLYDQYYEAELARPNLDVYLQNLYHDESELIVVFLCADYDRKEWCTLEWRAIRDLIKHRQASDVMPLRFDNTIIPGLFSIDGYVWISDRSADDVAKLIIERLHINSKGPVASDSSSGESQVAVSVNARSTCPSHASMSGGTTAQTDHELSEYEDGTNVPRGTQYYERVLETRHWYHPYSSRSSMGWQEQWRRLRARFEQVIDECRPVVCTLFEQRIPAYPESASQCQDGLENQQLLQFGGGLRRDLNQLFSRDGQPLFGEFPFHDIRGIPITNSVGEPFAFRLGLSRQFYLHYGKYKSRESRELPGPRLRELAQDGTSFLYRLPPNIAQVLWRNWKCGFCRNKHSNEYLWLDALFELSWRRQPGDALFSERHAWLGNISVQLEGQGIFPRLPDMSVFPGSISIPADNGYPVEWQSTLSDVARASIVAIDELLEFADNS